MKRFLFLLFGLIIGYILHSFVRFEPIDSVAQSFKKVPVLAQEETTEEVTEVVDIVKYDGISFNPAIVNLQYGDIIRIRNISTDKQMWLQSEISDLNTPRGYAESEQVSMRMYVEEGTYYVRDRNNEKALLEINVLKNK